MTDFITALGLVLVIEGMIWALVPQHMLVMMVIAAQKPVYQRRTAGVIALVLGVAVVWLARG
jgi:uncharacterized protein YjeT (DUF2065 family)